MSDVSRRVANHPGWWLALIVWLWAGALALPLACPAQDGLRLLAEGYKGRQICQQGFFRVLYYTAGKEAVPDRDENGNGIPDFVEDALIQLGAAHHVLCDLTGFPSPMGSARYPGLVSVDVFVSGRDTLKRRSGLSFSRSRPTPGATDPGSRSLVIQLANDIDPSANVTLAHEYFHLIQNGSSHVANAWYHEGLARWAEDALAVRARPPGGRESLDALLDDPGKFGLFALSYQAADVLWAPLAQACSAASVTLPEADPALDVTYVNGAPVLKDRAFSGSVIMRDVLARLADADHAPAAYGHVTWTNNAHSPSNNARVLNFVRQSLAGICG